MPAPAYDHPSSDYYVLRRAGTPYLCRVSPDEIEYFQGEAWMLEANPPLPGPMCEIPRARPYRCDVHGWLIVPWEQTFCPRCITVH